MNEKIEKLIKALRSFETLMPNEAEEAANALEALLQFAVETQVSEAEVLQHSCPTLFVGIHPEVDLGTE